jgi:hypothetical protein
MTDPRTQDSIMSKVTADYALHEAHAGYFDAA